MNSEPSPASVPELDNYGTLQFRKELDRTIQEFSSKGLDAKKASTWDQAGDSVAQKYGTNRGALSWIVLRHDFLKERKQSAAQYALATLNQEAQSALPGFEHFKAKTPEELLIDGEVVKRGDPRMTLQVMRDQMEIARDMRRKESGAYKVRSLELAKEATDCDDILKSYDEVAAKAWELWRVKPCDLIYDRKTKKFKPRPGAKSGPGRTD